MGGSRLGLSRRLRLLVFLLAAASVAGVTVVVALARSPAEPAVAGTGAGPPNFVLIVADDLPTRMYNHSPRIRRDSAAGGIDFTRAVTPTPLCCPARSTLLTGLYVHNHGVEQNRYRDRVKGGERRFLERGLETRTIAYSLQKAGYRTSLMGKYLNGYGKNDGGPSGSDPTAPPDSPGDQGSFPTRVPPGWSDWHAWFSGGMNENGRITHPSGHESDVITERASRFISAQAARERPFFLYLAEMLPHNENRPASRYLHAHDDARLPKPPSFNEADTSDKPAHLARDPELTRPGERPAHCSTSDWPIAFPTKDPDCWRSEDYSRHVWQYGLDGMESIDDLYNGVVAALKRAGKLDNTYIFFVSDNGVHLGEHRQSYGKNTPYLEDVVVPFTVRGPGIPANQRLGHLVGLQDIAPTIRDLAGLPIPSDMDGRSLRPLFSSSPPPPSRWRSRMLTEGYPGAGLESGGTADVTVPVANDTPRWSGELTRDRRSYVEYDIGEKELYRLGRDPFELDNQWKIATPSELLDLHDELAGLKACSGGESCRAAEDR